MISKNASGSSSSHERGASRLIRPKPLLANEAEDNGSADSDEEVPEGGGEDAHRGMSSRPLPEEEEVIEDQMGEEARQVKNRKTPKGPGAEERRLHRLTHYPFRSWCPECVAGRAKSYPHRRGDPAENMEFQEISLDYCFP